MLSASRTIAVEKSRFRGWALALARPGTGADTATAEPELSLDWPVAYGIFDVGPRKLRTSDGQASGAEIYGSAPRRLTCLSPFIPDLPPKL